MRSHGQPHHWRGGAASSKIPDTCRRPSAGSYRQDAGRTHDERLSHYERLSHCPARTHGCAVAWPHRQAPSNPRAPNSSIPNASSATPTRCGATSARIRTRLGGEPLPDGRARRALDHRRDQADGRIISAPTSDQRSQRALSAGRSIPHQCGTSPRETTDERPGGEISVEGHVATQLRDRPDQGGPDHDGGAVGAELGELGDARADRRAGRSGRRRCSTVGRRGRRHGHRREVVPGHRRRRVRRAADRLGRQIRVRQLGERGRRVLRGAGRPAAAQIHPHAARRARRRHGRRLHQGLGRARDRDAGRRRSA